MTIPQTLTVALGERSYPITIGRGLIAQAGRMIGAYTHHRRVIIITDENVAEHWLTPLKSSLKSADFREDTLILPAGESTKSFTQLESLLNDLLDLKPDRNTIILALGGGVIGDISGFAASILLRGIPFVQIPTTLLSQVDSSVGGKTGINTAQGKNLIGSFYQPIAVLIDTETLVTLPDRHLRNGYAEVIKYGCINQPDFFSWLEKHSKKILSRDTKTVTEAIYRCCHSKAEIVAEDEREKGARALLNLGHTFGHALEKATGYDDRLYHGEAVAIGMIMACDFSVRNQLCHALDLARLRDHCKAVGLPTRARHLELDTDAETLIATMRQDKKAQNNGFTFILMQAIGQSFISQNVNGDTLPDLLKDYI